MPQFLVLARGAGMDPRRSLEEMQRTIEKYRAWTEGIRRAGRLRQGEKLRSPEGRVVRVRGRGSGRPHPGRSSAMTARRRQPVGRGSRAPTAADRGTIGAR
jgi:hypothetical protein